MTNAPLPDNHPIIPVEKTGVLLVNLGTPEGTDAGSVRKYLREFLSDKRVVDYPRAFWLPILHGIILNTRPAKTGRAYAKIWREESNESPLRYNTRMQAEGVRAAVGDDTIIIDWAMRYGVPSIRERIKALSQIGCTRILTVPLYPQYSATTTATVNDEVFRTLMTMPLQPAIRTMPAFHDSAAYIEALGAVTTRHLKSLDFKPERILISFHGLPERYFQNGDPYHCHCAKTARLLREEMGWTEEFSPLTFQSKFGPEKWLSPATDTTLIDLATRGIKKIAVITPGFVSDCIETLEEIGIVGKEEFQKAGGEDLFSIPCLNHEVEASAMLTELIRKELGGWL